jgi:elongation factor G
MPYTTDSIKNVVLAGHGQTGKTTLFEALLAAGGAIARAETVDSGKTVSDYSPEEIERKISVHASLGHLEHKDAEGKAKKINFLDTPGSSDFQGDVILSFRAAEFALMLVDAGAGVQIETIKLWQNLDSRKKPRGVIVSKMDGERADFDKALADVNEKFKVKPVPVVIPMGSGANFQGVIDVLNEKAYLIDGDKEKEAPIPAEFKEAAQNARIALIEAAADGDDVLTEHYILMGSLEPEEIKKGLVEALALGKYVPAFAVSAIKGSGMAALLDFIAGTAPGPQGAVDVAYKAGSGSPEAVNEDGTVKPAVPPEEVRVVIVPNGNLSALVIRTTYDQFSGKLSWLKILTGSLSADSEVLDVSENKKERIGKLYTAQGKKLEEIKELAAGDIGIVTKSASFKTNDTITAGDASFTFIPLRLPEPVYSIAVNATEKKNDDKLGDSLVRATEEDKTFRYAYNAETEETIISGMGELQVNIILDKIKANQKIEIETRTPRVAYRETISKKSGEVEYTHKKQTGGHGQYGKVVIEIAPMARGGNYQFNNKIFGGHISKGYIPGIEKGIADGMARGVIAQYPVVDVEVDLLDGKEHPVDSNELSFRLAARNAFREAMKKCNPVLLEPISNLTVWVDEKYLGDVMSDLSGKRGRISGQEINGGIAEIKAEVPQAELLRYSIDLRSITSGTGSFSVAFSHYSPISGRIADDVIKAAEAFKKAEEED